jgi:ureidoacrylate peracid hydrolase
MADSLVFDKSKTALIVVDMQNGFIYDDTFLVKIGLDNTHLKPTVGPVAKLVEACHDEGVPVIFTRYILRPDYKDAGCFADLFPAARDAGALASGTWDVELVEALGARPDDFIVDKTRYSAFYNTNLEVVLRGLGVDTVVVCGVTTEICVESTIRDAFFRDYRIVVPSDAVAAIDPVRHEGTLRTISYGFGTVTTTGAVLKALTGVLVG